MEIYAEISKKLLKKIEEGHCRFNLPEGVALIRKKNFRACFITCEDLDGELVKELLDYQGIPWQEM